MFFVPDTHTHAHACTLENIQVYNSLVFFERVTAPLTVGADLYHKCAHADTDTQRARASMQAVRRNSFCGSGCVPLSQ